MKFHIIPYGELLVKIHMLRHDADLCLDVAFCRTDILSADADGAACRLRLHREHTNDRGFSRAVGPKETEHLTAPHGERNIRDRRLPRAFFSLICVRKLLDEMLHLDHHVFVHHASVRNGISAISRAFSSTVMTIRVMSNPASTRA